MPISNNEYCNYCWRDPPNITLATKFDLRNSVASDVKKQDIFGGIKNLFTSKITVTGSVLDGLPQFICVTAFDR